MSHKTDEIVLKYHAALKRLEGVNAELAKREPLVKLAAELEAEIAAYRAELATPETVEPSVK